jgi:hypothetical protein
VAIQIPDEDGPLPAGTGERTRSRVVDLANVPTLFGIHLDPLGLHGPLPRRECTSRCSDELTELVNKHLVPAARSRGSLITTAVPASAIPRWSRWALDAFVAVVADAAERGAEGVGKPIAEAVAAVTVPVYCGLLPRALEAAALAEISRAALAAGAAGIFLFDVEAMDEGRWSAFQDAVAGS